MLDVIVKLIKGGVVVNKNGEGNLYGSDASSVLGRAVLGKMKLGES